jgi:uncharacterized protein YoxC
MDPLHVVLIVLVIVAIWAVAELALVFRKTRTSLDELTHSVNETIEQVQPLLTKADGLLDDIQPAVKGVDPIVEQTSTSVGLLNQSLGKIDVILGDVSDVTGAASAATSAAGNVVDSATNAAADFVSKLTGKKAGRASIENTETTARLEGEAAADEDASVATTSRAAARGYVTYDVAPQPQDSDTTSDNE